MEGGGGVRLFRLQEIFALLITVTATLPREEAFLTLNTQPPEIDLHNES